MIHEIQNTTLNGRDFDLIIVDFVMKFSVNGYANVGMCFSAMGRSVACSNCFYGGRK